MDVVVLFRDLSGRSKFISVGVIIMFYVKGLMCFVHFLLCCRGLSCLVWRSGVSCFSVAVMLVIVVMGFLWVTTVITTLRKCIGFFVIVLIDFFHVYTW